MGRYIDWKDISNRYPNISDVGGANHVGSSYIGYVENRIDGLFADKFTVPFSSNNVTVKDLAIDMVYIKAGRHKVEQARELEKNLMQRIKDIKSGFESMITDSGTAIATAGEPVYSNTKDYHPTFGVSPAEYWSVDSAAIYDEESDRGIY